MEATIVNSGYIGMEKKMETTTVYWGYTGIMDRLSKYGGQAELLEGRVGFGTSGVFFRKCEPTCLNPKPLSLYYPCISVSMGHEPTLLVEVRTSLRVT